MIVTAALAWYDEAPEDLDRFVRSLAGFCDRFYAIGGRYARYPESKTSNPEEEAAALRDAAKDVGMPCVVWPDGLLWRGQVDKRNELYARAVVGSDWVFTLDADHLLHGPTEHFRDELAQCGHDAVEVPFYTTLNRALPIEQTASTDWHKEFAGRMIHHRLLVRALPGMRVERYHWHISALKGNMRYWLTAVRDGTYPIAPANRIDYPFCVEHRCLFRRERNILANREFCNDRVAIVAETDQEDVLEVA